jgi:DNA-binding transcriptional LysR family regulator
LLPQDYSLASREVDVAITLDRPQVGTVTTRKLTNYRLRLYGVAAYRDQYGFPARASELQDHRLCGYIASLLHTKELDYLNFANGPLVPTLKSTSIIAQMEMIRSGEAIGVLPCFIAAGLPALLEILPSEIKLQRSYWMSVHDDLKAASRVRAVCRALSDALRKDRCLFLGE